MEFLCVKDIFQERTRNKKRLFTRGEKYQAESTGNYVNINDNEGVRNVFTSATEVIQHFVLLDKLTIIKCHAEEGGEGFEISLLIGIKGKQTVNDNLQSM